MAALDGTLALPSAGTCESQLELQYFRMPVAEQRRFRKIIRNAAALDRQLADLHLQFPTLEVRHYSLKTQSSQGISPSQLLRWIAVWHAARRRS